MTTTHLALLRHGQSEWNLENRFTGWVDVDLTERGRAEAATAGELLAATGAAFSGSYASVLKRAIRTLWLALDAMDRMWLPTRYDWRLNERHYGALTGLDKQETAERHGADQVKIWRRGFDTPPPPLAEASPHDPTRDPRYASIDPRLLPRTESLKSTLDRVAPLWTDEIAPQLAAGRSLLVVAHGNSLRALVKTLLGVSDADIVGVEIPTGNPLLFDLEPGTARPRAARYLDPSRAEALPRIP